MNSYMEAPPAPLDDEVIESKKIPFKLKMISCGNCNDGTEYWGHVLSGKICTFCPVCKSTVNLKVVGAQHAKEDKNPSDHYAQLDIKPIDVAEQRISTGFSTIGNVGNWHLATAIEYLMRAGLKSGQPWRKDVQKALDHGYRAIHGRWPWDSELQ